MDSMIRERSSRATASRSAPHPNTLLPFNSSTIRLQRTIPSRSLLQSRRRLPWKGKGRKIPRRNLSPQKASHAPGRWRLERGVAAATARQRGRGEASTQRAASRQKEGELERRARARGRGAQAPALRNLELIRVERGLAEAEGGKKEERMKKALEIKAKLKEMGLCPIGYEWIRRAGGSHCMANGMSSIQSVMI
ncbi:hypothetical protein F4824DRAFT_286979 [Ustulina deusta]|nr:hypothetical protein F4824DRAFT_286979 [Ustulina deusta]